MCDFCEFCFSIDSEIKPSKTHITYDRDSDQFDIQVETADPYDGGILEGVKFCPYCGEKLKITKRFTAEIEEEDNDPDRGKPWAYEIMAKYR